MYPANTLQAACVLYSLASMAGRTSHVPLAYVIPCINQASQCYKLCIDLHCAVEYIPVIEALRYAAFVYCRDRESLSLIVSD